MGRSGGRIRWLSTTLALGLCLLGCGLAPAPVPLLTGVSGCYAGGETGAAGVLFVDPDYGTRLNGMPVMWPVGFTGVQFGGQVDVLDAGGALVASTGKRYYISHGPVDSADKQRLMETIGAFTAAANCDYPWDLIDCGSPTSSQRDIVERSCWGP
jgi:hypothetical protein